MNPMRQTLLGLCIVILLSFVSIPAKSTAQNGEIRLNSIDSLCLAIGQEAGCELPENLETIAEERETALQNMSMQPMFNSGSPIGPHRFEGRVTPLNGVVPIDGMYVPVGTQFEYYVTFINEVNYARTATITSTLNLRHQHYTEPEYVCHLGICSLNNGFTQAMPRYIGMASGQRHFFDFQSQINWSGFAPSSFQLRFDLPRPPAIPPGLIWVSGLWGLEISSEGFGDEIHLSNSNSSINGGNSFFYKAILPEGVHLIGAMEHGQNIDPSTWNGQTEVYLEPGASTELGAVFAATTAGTYDITVEVYSPEVVWDEQNNGTFVPKSLLYSKKHTLDLPAVNPASPVISWREDFAQATEAGEDAVWLYLERTGDISEPFSTTLTVSGLAIQEDFQWLTNSVEYGSQVLDFQPGMVGQWVPIRVLDDSLYEGTESLIFQLHNASPNAIIGGKGRAVVEILDNEKEPEAVLRMDTSTPRVAAGKTFTATVTVTNTGTADLNGSQFGAELLLDNVLNPDIFEVVSVQGVGTGAREWFNINGRLTVQWTFFDLAPGESRSYTVELKVKPETHPQPYTIGGAILIVGTYADTITVVSNPVDLKIVQETHLPFLRR